MSLLETTIEKPINNTIEVIEVQREQSVQILPDIRTGMGQNVLSMNITGRGPLLPSKGTRARERELLALYRHDDNMIFKGAISGLTKRVQSTPWEVKGEPELANYFQNILMESDFGEGWESFLSKMIINYSRSDIGAVLELIGPGSTVEPMTGAITGLSVLDSLRSYPTGDPEFPVIYYDAYGAMHAMHYTRVVRFVDMPEASEDSFYYGECSLSRCATPVTREILMARYIQQTLDDNPLPGIAIFKNLTDKEVRSAYERMEQERSTDSGGQWGKTLKLFGMQAEIMPEVEFVTFTDPPEKFDFQTYTNLDAKQIALGIGLDIQDIWELTGQGMGTATQSEIMHTKSKGRALGRILKGLERTINQTFPESIEFAFKYKDEEEDQQNANLAQTWLTNGESMQRLGYPDEIIAQTLANQVPAIHDVSTDAAGVLRLPDDDPKAPAQETPSPTPQLEAQAAPEDNVVVDDNKELHAVQQTIMDTFYPVAIAAREGIISKGAMKAVLKQELVTNGRRALIDGMRDGGIELPEITKSEENLIGRWRAQQLPFVDKFAESVFKDDQTDAQLRNRAQMWVNKSINPLYYEGLAIAAKDNAFMWIIDPVKEHCVDCLRLNGQIHKMKDYIVSGFLPQSPRLDCKGYNCGCSLVPTDLKATGRLGGKKRKPGVFRRIIGKIVNLFKITSKAGKAGFDEGKHPRADDGKFGSGGGGGDSDGNGDDGDKYESGAGSNPEFQKQWSSDFDNIKKEPGPPKGTRIIESTNHYTDEGYHDINGALRGTSDKVLDEKTITSIQDMDNLTKRRLLKQDIKTFRSDDGAGLPNGGNLSDAQFKKLKGSTFTDKGFTSTATDTSLGNTFGDHKYEYRIPAGSRGAYVDSVSKWPNEREFLLGRGSTSNIVDAKINEDGTRTLVLELIPDA